MKYKKYFYFFRTTQFIGNEKWKQFWNQKYYKIKIIKQLELFMNIGLIKNLDFEPESFTESLKIF